MNWQAVDVALPPTINPVIVVDETNWNNVSVAFFSKGLCYPGPPKPKWYGLNGRLPFAPTHWIPLHLPPRESMPLPI